MLCRKDYSMNSKGSVPVYLNIYDITPINVYAYWIGLGAYHSGVQVHGVEYAFGGHEYPTTGIVEGPPKQCDGFRFRKAILIGWTELSAEEVTGLMAALAEDYKGNAYNLITKNCNHFCNDACIRLSGNPIPSWVNRLARIGFLCSCMIPAGLGGMKIQHSKAEEKVVEDDKIRSSSSNCFATWFKSSSSSLPSASSSRRRRSVSPTSTLMMGSPSPVT
ncbi:hypothetical protein Nepgr_016146 [Nepenthes gracilis]|uniref:PPPDE domain-containing protein n=1 Tax=Nepenthes gracilis TaxID=150966 RepID=A0AAD3SP53_NEPGR|nr:hypothetical protein Nepgr_016146 [Nepenthes gracilis]